VKKIKLTKGQVVKVDDEDFEKLNKYKWRLSRSKYACYAVTGLDATRMHRLIMRTPPDLVVHHKDNDGLNNQKSNLLNCTQSLNIQKAKRDSKHSGIWWNELINKYVVSTKCNGKFINLGSYTSLEYAIEIYNEATLKLFGKEARLNFMEEE
jgi:hypothetical protein